MYRDYTSNHDVRPWIAEALSDERLYEDREPSSGSAISASSQRLETAEFLEKVAKEGEIAGDLFKDIAERLASCEPGRRCLSGTCPECMRATQRHLVTETQKFLKTVFRRPEEVNAVSFIWKEVPQGDLYTHPKSPRVENAVKRMLRASGIELALGGVDINFEENRYEDSSHWSFHVGLLISAGDRGKLEHSWASALPYGALKIHQFDGNWAGVFLKTKFVRRLMQVLEDGDDMRVSSSKQALREEERCELLNHLDQAGLTEGLVLLGARPMQTKAGGSIVRTKR